MIEWIVDFSVKRRWLVLLVTLAAAALLAPQSAPGELPFFSQGTVLLEQADEVLAGIAAQADRLGVVAAELLLGDVAVVALELLLGAQLRAEVAHLALAALAVLAGAVLAAVDGALRAAPDVLAHAAVELVLRLNPLRHIFRVLS